MSLPDRTGLLEGTHQTAGARAAFRHRLPLTIVSAAVLGLLAQGGAQTPAINAVDVYFVSVTTTAVGELPRVEVVGSQRFQAPAGRASKNFVPGSRQGTLPGLQQLDFASSEGTEGGLTISYSYRWRGSSMFGMTSSLNPPTSLTLGMSYGRRERGGTRLLLVLEATGETSTPEARTPEDLATAVASALVAPETTPLESEDGLWNFLAALPLSRYLDPRLGEQLLARAQETESGQGSSVVSSIRRRMQSGARGIHGSPSREIVRLLIGDSSILSRWTRERAYSDFWTMPRSLALAYASVEDPTAKGAIGWHAVEWRTFPREAIEIRLAAPFEADLASGKAIMPGSPDEVVRRRTLVADLAREKQVRLPLLALGLGASSLILLAFLIRQLGRVAY